MKIPRRRLQAVRRAALMAALVVLVLEGGVRVLGLAPPIDGQYSDNVRDPVLPFKPRPLSRLTGRAASGEFSYDYQHNSHGFRDVEHAEHKPASALRIVALGDSFTYGVGAAFTDTYPSQLARLLDQRAAMRDRVEMISLGLPRYFPAAERLVLEQYGLRYQPDVVIAGILPNDVIDTLWGIAGMNLGPLGVLLSPQGQRLGAAGVWLYLHSQLARSLLSRWAVYASTVDERPRSEDVFREHGPYEATWTAMEADLASMADSARAHRAAFAIVSIPQSALGIPENAYLEQRLSRWSAAHDVLFIPTLAAFRAAAADGTALHWRTDGHCTAAGYGIISQQILSALVDRGLVQ